MDKLQWFKFTPSDWMMGKIQRCPEITQARFIRLCCLYWNKDCEISIDDAVFEIDQEHFEILKKRKIISVDNQKIFIAFLDEQFLEIKETSKDRSVSGIIGNLKRWHADIYNSFLAKEISLEKAVELSKSIATLSPTDGNPIANPSQSIADIDKSKSKTRQEKDIDKSNILRERKLKFASTLEIFIPKYGRDLINDFYRYWTEPNKSNTKFKQEMEKTWDVERRIEKWASNNFNSKQSIQEKPKYVTGRQTQESLENSYNALLKARKNG